MTSPCRFSVQSEPAQREGHRALEDGRVDGAPVLHLERPALNQPVEDAHILLDDVRKGIVRRHCAREGTDALPVSVPPDPKTGDGKGEELSRGRSHSSDGRPAR